MSSKWQIRAGRLRHRVKVQRFTETSDGMGSGGDRSWADLFQTQASVEPMVGSEFMQAMQLTASITHKVTMRYREGVTAKDRVKWGTRIFKIRSVINPKEMNYMLELMCEEQP